MSSEPKVVVDPGHGGTDPGAVNGSLVEKALTWKVSNLIKDKLCKGYQVDVEVIQPSAQNPKSTSDDELIIPPREAKKLHADYYLSIHINAGGGTGFESFIHPTAKGSAADQIRSVLHNHVAAFLASQGLPDRGKKYENYYVLRKTTQDGIPSCLVELLFIDKSKDAAFLKREEFLNSLSNEVAYGLAKALKLTRRV